MNKPPACETLHSSPFTNTAFSVEIERETKREKGREKGKTEKKKMKGTREMERLDRKWKKEKVRKFEREEIFNLYIFFSIFWDGTSVPLPWGRAYKHCTKWALKYVYAIFHAHIGIYKKKNKLTVNICAAPVQMYALEVNKNFLNYCFSI